MLYSIFSMEIGAKKETLSFDSVSFLLCKWQLALLTHTSEAVAAVDGTIGLGLEGNLSLAAAGCASSSEILTGATSSSLASVTASLAALGLILEPALGVELLLTSGEHELLTTFFAYQSLVFVHCKYPLFDFPGPEKTDIAGIKILRSAFADFAR